MSKREYITDMVVDAFRPTIGVHTKQGYINIITKYVISRS